MNTIKIISRYTLLFLSAWVIFTSCSNGPETKTATTDTVKKAKWVDPCKGKMYSKMNYVQIPLTANEQHLLGKVKSVSYKDYKLSENPDSLKVLDDSGYNVYDQAGHLIDQTEYDAKGNIKWQCKYAYDAQNRATEYDLLFPDRKEHEKVVFKYDAKGNKIEETAWHQNNTQANKVIRKYDDKRQETELIYYGKTDKEIFLNETYKYDDRGNQIELTMNMNKGKRTSRRTCEYDKDGYKTGGADYRSGTIKPEKWIAKNDALGRQTERIEYDTTGNIDSRTTMKYDEWDNYIEYTHYKKDGSVDNDWSFSYKNEYDANGNIIKQTEYKMKNGKKTAVSHSETAYTYY